MYKPVAQIFVAISILSLGCLPGLADLIRIETNTQLRAVYLVEDRDSHLTLINPVFLAGEVDAQGPEGMSHYLEHLMFWHADNAGGKKIHGRSGNAWVNGIITSYYTEGNTASDLDDLFEFAARLLTPPQLSKQFMIDEKKVVEREYDLRLSGNSDRKLFEKMQTELFGDHPVGRSVIGTPESIRALDLEAAYEFHQEYYNRANLVLLIRSNLSPGRVRALVEKTFAGGDAGIKHARAWRGRGPVVPMHSQIEYVAGNLESDAYKYFATAKWSGSGSGSGDRLQDNYTAYVTRKLLNSSLEGSLAKPLRLDNFVASGLHSRIDPLLDGQIQFQFFARPDEGISLKNLATKFSSALKTLAGNGVPEKSLERMRKRLLREAIRRADEPQFIFQRSFSFLRNGVEPNGTEDNLRRLKAVSKEDIDNLLTALAKPVRSVEGFLRKEK